MYTVKNGINIEIVYKNRTCLIANLKSFAFPFFFCLIGHRRETSCIVAIKLNLTHTYL